MKYITVIALVLAMGFLISSASAELECVTRSSNCQSGETALFYMSEFNNAHFSQTHAIGYEKRICCRESSGAVITTSCSGVYDTVIRLSSTINAHGQGPGQSGYPVQICLSVEGGSEVDCQLSTTQSCETAFGSGYECVTGLSAATNAHGMRCSPSPPARICCKTQALLNAWFEPPLPDWTTVNYIDVSWNSDNPGVDTYDVEYNVNGGSWTNWFSTTSQTSATLTPVVDGSTYNFRVRVNLGGGVTSDWVTDSTTVDMTPPTCAITPLPEYTLSTTFSVDWLGSDATSGVRDYTLRRQINVDPWHDVLSRIHTTEINYQQTGAIDGYTYSYQCEIWDNAGNYGNSDITSTIVDANPPISWLDEVPRWSNQFDPAFVELTWDGTDGEGTGIACFNVHWRTGTGTWNGMLFPDSSQTICPNERTLDRIASFDEATTTIIEDIPYFFRIGSEDNAGHIESPHGDTRADTETEYGWWNVTFDWHPPEITPDVVFDEENNEITLGSSSTDAISGVESHSITYNIMRATGENEVENVPCGHAPHHGGTSMCPTEGPIDLDGVLDFFYVIESIDRAGNVFTVGDYLVAYHILANFLSHNIFLPLGQTRIVKVVVKNLQGVPDTVDVRLGEHRGGTTEPDYNEEFYGFVGHDIDNYLVDGNNKHIRVTLSGEDNDKFKIFFVSIESTNQIDQTFRINLDASSTLALVDSDELFITIGYSPEFPGMGIEAIILLIIMTSMIIYLKGAKYNNK